MPSDHSPSDRTTTARASVTTLATSQTSQNSTQTTLDMSRRQSSAAHAGADFTTALRRTFDLTSVVDLPSLGHPAKKPKGKKPRTKRTKKALPPSTRTLRSMRGAKLLEGLPDNIRI
ncbi:hypothetical protein B0A50_00143 [Salinomyces thailandicus]|uniref:Uncharacterized protein n=1 Tax=Salinomyces thailandicus TaxID=706561 RepID=A0A4U0UF52_9PEZI|nr:hypothetical protein B0A50_00143 [Salinomyces thailandica]